jgi:hypothetical protein
MHGEGQTKAKRWEVHFRLQKTDIKQFYQMGFILI